MGHGVRTNIPSRPSPPAPQLFGSQETRLQAGITRRRVLEGLVTAQNTELPWAPSIYSLWFPRHTGSEGSSLCSH